MAREAGRTSGDRKAGDAAPVATGLDAADVLATADMLPSPPFPTPLLQRRRLAKSLREQSGEGDRDTGRMEEFAEIPAGPGRVGDVRADTASPPMGTEEWVNELQRAVADATRAAIRIAHAADLAVPGRRGDQAIEVRPDGTSTAIPDDTTWSPTDWQNPGGRRR